MKLGPLRPQAGVIPIEPPLKVFYKKVKERVQFNQRNPISSRPIYGYTINLILPG